MQVGATVYELDVHSAIQLTCDNARYQVPGV